MQMRTPWRLPPLLLLILLLVPPVSPATAHRVYLVFDTPQSPMAIPWTEVLEDACGFARYRSTASDVARYCTTGLFFAQRFYYPGDYRSHWTSEYPYWMRFKLTQYYNTPGWVAGNCVDVSDFLCICLRALGLDFVVAQFRNNLSTPSMVTNPICLIGSDPTQDSSYQSLPNPFNPPFDKPWGMHQFALSPWGGSGVRCLRGTEVRPSRQQLPKPSI